MNRANKGRNFEEAILRSSGNVVYIHKHTAGVKWIGPGKTISLPGPVDFLGCVIGSGRMIAFDAKQTEKVQGFYLSDLAEHQQNLLIGYGTAGAIAGLLIESTSRNVVYWCDWKRLNVARVRGVVFRWDELTVVGPSHLSIDFRRLPALSAEGEAKCA